MTASWKRLAAVADCPPGTCLEAVAGERVIALFNVTGKFYALDGVCPHQGGPLGRGTLEGQTVTCPWHGWQFDVCTGRCRLSPSVVQPTIPVRIEEDVVLVQV
ncbi:MAG: Rieske 2Fe-2S domain-containing protein [Planctomycetales bacterium]|nr:Rieske 2Fe-2S domain-containing protein [Planctomycetales bacterium]